MQRADVRGLVRMPRPEYRRSLIEMPHEVRDVAPSDQMRLVDRDSQAHHQIGVESAVRFFIQLDQAEDSPEPPPAVTYALTRSVT